MRLKSILLSGAVLVMCVGMFPDAPHAIRSISTAQAQNVSLNFSVFYDGLRDDGEWVRYHGRYVFVPSYVDDDWRPYTRGHWAHTTQYGWVWVSDERFGWATYHYGRWGYAQDIGWYWVPGKRWAPAWVSWRRTDRDVSWAPLTPDYDDDYYDRNAGASISVSASIGSLPFYFWVNVPARNFQDRNLDTRIVRDQDENRRIYERSQFAGPVVVQNNTIINNVINVNFIQQQSGKPVQTVAVTAVNDPAAAKAQQPGQQNAVPVFEGALKADTAAKPADVKPVEQVTQQQATKPKLPGATPSTNPPPDGGQPVAPADATKQPDAAPQPDANTQGQPPKAEAPVVAHPKTELPKAEPPKAEPPKDAAPAVEPPQAEPPKTEPPKAEPPKAEPPKDAAPAAEPPQAEPPKTAPPKVEPPKAEPQVTEPPKAAPPKDEPPKADQKKALAPQAQPPKAEPPKAPPPKVEASQAQPSKAAPPPPAQPKAAPPPVAPPKAAPTPPAPPKPAPPPAAPPKAAPPPAAPPQAAPPKAPPPKAEPCKPGDKSCPPAK